MTPTIRFRVYILELVMSAGCCSTRLYQNLRTTRTSRFEYVLQTLALLLPTVTIGTWQTVCVTPWDRKTRTYLGSWCMYLELIGGVNGFQLVGPQRHAVGICIHIYLFRSLGIFTYSDSNQRDDKIAAVWPPFHLLSSLVHALCSGWRHISYCTTD